MVLRAGYVLQLAAMESISRSISQCSGKSPENIERRYSLSSTSNESNNPSAEGLRWGSSAAHRAFLHKTIAIRSFRFAILVPTLYWCSSWSHCLRAISTPNSSLQAPVSFSPSSISRFFIPQPSEAFATYVVLLFSRSNIFCCVQVRPLNDKLLL